MLFSVGNGANASVVRIVPGTRVADSFSEFGVFEHVGGTCIPI